MKSLYESILSSTKSGKNHFLEWSKVYLDDQWEKAANDYCKFYDIRAGMIKNNIKDLFLSFVQKSNPIIESFKFVQDYNTEEKIIENTDLNIDKVRENKAFSANRMNIYLILESDDKYWIWTRETQVFERVYYSKLSKYLENK